MVSLRPCKNFCKNLRLVLTVLLSALKFKLCRLPPIFQMSKGADHDLPCTCTDLLLCSGGCKEQGDPGLMEAPQRLWWSAGAMLLYPGGKNGEHHKFGLWPVGCTAMGTFTFLPCPEAGVERA